MSTRVLPDWVDAYMEFTENTEPPENFRLWVGLSTIASVLERKCSLVWGTETFYPNMYIVLCGPPATRKGTAMRVGKQFLDELGINVASDESSRQKLVKSLQESISADQDMDGTMVHHSSLTIHASELTVFLGYGSREMLSMLCKWYDCEGRYVYDTHARGKEEVPNVWVHLFGATTPGQLRAALPEDAVGSGFTSRIVFISEDKKGKTVLKPDLTDRQKRLGELLSQDLAQIRNMVGPFLPTPEYEEIYYDWYQDSESRQIFADPRLEYYVQRRPTHLFKLSMLCCASRSLDKSLEAEDIQRAISLLHSAEKTMPKVFAGVGANPLAGAQTKLENIIRERGFIRMDEAARILSDDVSHQQLGEVVGALKQQGLLSQDIKTGMLTYKEPEYE
tara:strand:+ start:561 stop:1736 length:1176 start_codon:yes stop_codon:yes gene_type:complete